MLKFIRSLVLGLAVFSIVFASINPVSAVSGSSWRAGNIISDSVFTNKSAMTVSQIQNWLDARLKNCDPQGTKPSEWGGPDYNNDGVTTRAEYGRSQGNPAPFTCLNKYYEVPKTSPAPGVPASNYGKVNIPAGAKSAARLIYDAAQAHNISPKVLLVKLGTESAGPLTSDTWPFKSQYTYAMGAHCPDSGPGGSANCDSDYAGFSLQMRESAKLLRWYLDNMTESWWTYKKPYQTNYILWNVSPSGCGGGNVYITNKSTAALYTYTPYQPNQAALNNLYGTGDRCSAYGNRNFWRVYNEWFGSTQLLKFDSMSSPRWMTIPTDMRKTDLGTGLPTGSTIPAGTEVYFVDKTWLYDDVFLRTKHDNDNKVHSGISLSDLEEVTRAFSDMSAPRWMMPKQSIRKIDPITQTASGSTINKGLMIYFTTKFQIGGELYVRTSHDSGADARRGFLYSDLTDAPVAVQPMSAPRYFQAKSDLRAIDTVSGEFYGATIAKDSPVLYEYKFSINGVLYLRTSTQASSTDFVGIPIRSLEDISGKFLSLGGDEVKRVKTATHKINTKTLGQTGGTLDVGREITFSDKIYIGDKLYWRTSHDSSKGYIRAIPDSDLEPVS